MVWFRTAGAARQHRGDWEPADSVIVAYAPALTSTLEPLVQAIAAETSVLLVVPDESSFQDALDWVATTGVQGAVDVIATRLDTPWVRDYGPLQVRAAGGLVWLDASYGSTRPSDDVFPIDLGSALGVPLESLEERLDGGAFLSDGAGLCASTRESFAATCLDPSYASSFLDRLGCRALALVPALEDDEAQHIDMLAQFVAPGEVVVASLDPARWPEDAARLDEAVATLRAAAAFAGSELRVTRVPMHKQGRTYFPYVNGLRVGGSFLMPSYRAADPGMEMAALGALAAAMPGIAVEPIPADALEDLGGSLHCITMGITDPSTTTGRTDT